MKAYFDTSFLICAYVRDANSAKVAAILKSGRGPLLCPPLVELELRNAVRLCAFRGELTAARVLGARAFYSFDRRQTQLAKDAGLKALPS